MLDAIQLEELLDDIRIRILEANRRGTLADLLDALGMSDLLATEEKYETYSDGKIVVIGGSEVKEDVLKVIAGKAGLDKSRLEFCLDYDAAQKYNYSKLYYAPQYRVVLFGAVPHSSSGKGHSGSVIAEMENKEGYPRVIRLMAGDQLKLTKSNFKQAIEGLVAEGYI